MDKDVVPTCNGIPLSQDKERENAFAATWMDLEMIILSEVNEKEKDKCNMIALVYGI